MDKSNWPRGIWDYEPDNLEWVDNPTDLVCHIRRHEFGYLCGYVAICEHHPWYYLPEEEWLSKDLPSHGGITCADYDPGHLYLWVGFGCYHEGDFIPGMTSNHPNNDVYRTWDYVKNIVEKLAKELYSVRGEQVCNVASDER